MRHLTALAVITGMVATTHAGIVVEPKNRVKFGKVSEEGTGIVLEIKIGDRTAKAHKKKEDVVWWSTKDEVTDYYTAAVQALEDKKFDIATELAKESARREPGNKEKAKELLTKIDTAKSGATATKPEPGDGDGGDGGKKGTDNGGEVKVVKGGKLYDALKDHLLDPKTGKKFQSKTWGKADYYLLCYVSLKYPGTRDSLRKVIDKYDRIKKDFDGKVEILFYPIDADPKVLSTHIPNLKIPFPILHSKIAFKTSLIKHKTTSASFAIVDAAGNLVMKGDNSHRLLIDLEFKLDE